MSEVEFFLVPITNIKDMSSEQVMNLSDMVKRIGDNEDSVVVPNEFYMYEDIDKDSIQHHLGDNSTEMRLLIETITKCPSYAGSYTDLYDDVQDYKAYISIDNIPLKVKEKCALNNNEVVSIYRDMVNDSFDYDSIMKWRGRCFPNLCFTEDTVNSANSIGPFSENRIDIMKSLSALNDVSENVLESYTEPQKLEHLKSVSGVDCSGKGSKEKSTFKKDILFSTRNEEECVVKYAISCIPHFKLDTRHSDKRLHFSWGRKEIFNHRIIVVHIGCHWKDDVNSKESKIMPVKEY